MNIGIVIGVSKYNLPGNDLPACKNDSDVIYEILDKTDKYEEILKINDNEISQIVKEKLTDFVSKFDSQKIEEIFFYYSGHGEFYNNEFYYLMNDYDPAKRKQTSIENTELDNYFKSLNPTLVIKIIDACQSGKNYIKNTDSVKKYFKDNEKQFNNCYFLNSSLYNQNSYIYGSMSEFTFSFVCALKNHSANDIRYKDIIDFIVDEFENNTEQTPFFIVQANYREKFCTLTKPLKEYILTIDKNAAISVPKDSINSLLAKIKNDSKYYIEKKDVDNILLDIKNSTNDLQLNETLCEIFDLQILFEENYDRIAKRSIIGNWILENPKLYFAKPKYDRIVDKENPLKNFYPAIFGSSARTSLLDSKAEYKDVLSGFDLEIEVPFKTISFDLTSKFSNIDSYCCRIIFLISKKQIRFFYFITNIEEKNWDDKKINLNFDWETIVYDFKDIPEISNGIKKIFDSTQLKVTTILEEKYK